MSGPIQQSCPLCARENGCRVAMGALYKGECWCQQIVVPQPVLKRLAENTLETACLCRPCLETLARISGEESDPDLVVNKARAVITRELIAAGADFYLDEFGNTVFTAAYHLKRGSCCGNQCRHCPY